MKNKFPLFMLFFFGVMLLTCASIGTVKYNTNYISYDYLSLLDFQKTGHAYGSDGSQNGNSITLQQKRTKDDGSDDLQTDTATVQQSLFGSLENMTGKKPKKARTDLVFGSQDFMTMVSDDIAHYGANVGLGILFFDQDTNSFLMQDLAQLTKSFESAITSQNVFDVSHTTDAAVGTAQVLGLDVKDETEIASLLLFACLVTFVLVSYKNEKIKLKNTKFLSIFFIVILLSSATLTPFSMGQKYWGMAFAEPFNQTDNTVTNDTIPDIVNSTIDNIPTNSTIDNIATNSTIGDIITNSTIIGTNETSSTSETNETINYNMPSLATGPVAENLTNSTGPNYLSYDLSDTLSIYDNSTILQNHESGPLHVPGPIHDNITISSDVGITDNVATSYNGSVPAIQGASNLSADVSLSDSINVTKIGITIPNATKSWNFASDNGTEGKTEISNNTLTLQGNGYIHENIDSSNVLKNFTVSAWIKPDYSQGSPVFAIVSKTNQFALDLNNNIPPSKAATFSVFDGVRWNTINSTVPIPENSWTYLAGVYNGTSISLYVNGTLQSSYTLQGVLTVSDDGHLVPVNPDQISSNYDMVIGASVNPTRSSVMDKFSGDIQNVNFYKQILGPEQISKIYQQNTQTASHDIIPLGENMTVTDSILVSSDNSTNSTGINSMQVVPTIQTTKPSYSIGENPEFVFKVFKDSDLKKIRAEVKHAIQQNGWSDKNSTISVKILSPNGTQIPVSAQFAKLKEGQFDIKIPSKRFGKPGMYTIQATLVQNGKTYTTQEQYAWGLVSVNTDKSIYRPGQTANMTIVVLDSHGSPVCDAQVSMNVVSPDSGSTVFSSGNGITQGSECGLYGAQYATTTEGNYTVNVSAKENSINTNFSTSFLVQNNFAFDITRAAQSKIDPKSNPNLFGVKIDVTSFTNATSITIKESVPAVFDVKTDGTVQTVGDAKIISWNKNLVSNKTSVQYSYSVPMVFPQLYALGPAKIEYGNNTSTESRQWFVANDPPADTIQFDGVPTSQGFSANSVQKNMSLIIGNNPNRLLLVQVVLNSATVVIAAVSWKGIHLTPIGTGNINSSKTIQFFYLTNPPIGTGNVTVDTTVDPSTKGVIGAYSLYGVDQTTPVIKSGTNTKATSAMPSITLTNSHDNSLLIDLAGNPSAIFDTPCPTCTIAWNNNGGASAIQAGSQWMRTATAGTPTAFSWTLASSKAWIMTGVEVIPAGIMGQNETMNISDNISKSVTKTLSDSISVNDQISDSRLFTTSDSDQISISEQLSTLRTRNLSLSDSISISDQSTALHFNEHYYDGLPVTVTTSPTSLASYTPGIPAGDNLVIVSAQFDGSSTGSIATVSSGSLQLKKNGVTLTSNPFDINVEGDTQGTKQASTVLFYKDTGAAANPTYDVTSLASQNISGEVKILVIHEAPYSSFGNNTVFAIPSAKSTIFSHTPTLPSGNNLVLAEINLHTVGASKTFNAGTLDIERNSTILSSNENKIQLDSSTNVINSHSVLLIASDANAPSNPTYDITADPSGTGVNGQVQIFVIQGLAYSFVDSANTALTTSDSTLASNTITTNGIIDKIAIIAGVETASTTAALKTINPGAMKISTGGVTQSSNEFGIETKGTTTTSFRDHILLDSNNNFGLNPTFNVIESASATGVNAETKVVAIDLNIRSISLADGISITDSIHPNGVKGFSLSDSVGISEQSSASRIVFTSVPQDQVSISEQLSALRIANLSLSDSISISDQSTALHFNEHYYDGLPVTVTTSPTSLASYTPGIPAGDNLIIVSAQFNASSTIPFTTISSGSLQLKKNGVVLTSNPFDINLEGDTPETGQVSTVLLYKDTGASSNPTYDVVSSASHSVLGEVKILVIHEAPNSSFGNGTVVTLDGSTSNLLSHTYTVPSGDNLVLAEINLHNTDTSARTFAAGAIDIERSGTVLSSNENAVKLDTSANVINSHSILLIASDPSAPTNPTYDVISDQTGTRSGTRGQAQVFVIQGLKYSFVDGVGTSVGNSDTQLASGSILTNGVNDKIATIAAVETLATNTRTINPGGMKLSVGGVVQSTNEFGMNLKTGNTQFRDHVLLDGNNNFGQNPTFGVTEAQSGTNAISGEAKIVAIDLSSKSMSLTDNLNMNSVLGTLGNKSTSLSDSLSVSDTVSKKPGITLSDSSTMSDALTTAGNKSTSLSDSLSVSDTVSKKPGITLSDSSTVSDALATSNGPSISLSDSVSLNAAFSTSSSLVKTSLDQASFSDGIEVTKGGSSQVIISDTTQSVTIQSGKTDLLISGNDTALSTVNVPSNVPTATLNYSKIASTNSSSTTIGIVNPLEIKKDLDGNGVSDVQVTLPANITINGGSSWKGDITVPTVTSAPTIPATQGQTITVSKTIEIGSSKVPLSFDKAVRILFVGEAGKKVGYFNSNTSFTEITQSCSDDTQATNNGLASGGDCTINVGSDLVVWTKHFTGFSTFTSTSTPGTTSSTGFTASSNAGGGSTGAAASGASASSSSSEGGEGPYLKIQNVSYDICDKQIVRIQVGTDINSTNPMVLIRTSLTGVVYASLAQDQPYERENANADIRQLVYEATISGQEKSFEVVALESVGHNVFSVGKTIDVTDCKANFDYSHIGLMVTPSTVDTSAPKIFDVRFQADNGTKILSSDDYRFVDSKQLSVFAIADSASSLDSAELRFEKQGDDTANYQTISMTATPLQVSNTTYILSGVIPKGMLQTPATSYWVNVKNSVGKTSESDHYTIGVKPTYGIGGKLEFDLKSQNRAEGSTGTPTAYFTNYSDGPLYGTVSLIVDGTMVYTSPGLEFDANQTAVPLKWKTLTLGDIVTHHLSAVAQFYGKSITSGTQQVATFPSTKTVPISVSPINIDVLKDQNGTVVATPQILYASYAPTGSENFKIIAPDGTCVIGPVNCLVTNSTSGETQYRPISIGDQNYRVRYFEGSTLERFSISSVDPIIGQWHVEIDSNGNPQHNSVTDNVSLEIKYSHAK